LQDEAPDYCKRGKVLVVDDELVNREIMQEILDLDFEVTYASSGDECLDLAPKLQPGVILLDINMPGMNGYEVCQLLKQNEATKMIPVTFVSALDTLAERLAGYEAGGDDYIIKPFEPSELVTKVNVALKLKASLEKIKQNADMALNTAMTAMNSTSELGVLLHFLQESFKNNDLEVLAKLIISAMQSFGLSSVVQIRSTDGDVNLNNSGTVNPLEAAVIERICREERVFDMGRRSIFNEEHVSILIRNMPVEDADKVGRLKDNITLLAGGAEARVQAILMQRELDGQRQGLLRMVESLRTALACIDKTHEAHKAESTRILTVLINQMEESFSFPALSETQVQHILKMANQAVQDVIDIYEEGLGIDARLAVVMDDLKAITKDTQ
jgi:CheY-like chemotaxis protein